MVVMTIAGGDESKALKENESSQPRRRSRKGRSENRGCCGRAHPANGRSCSAELSALHMLDSAPIQVLVPCWA